MKFLIRLCVHVSPSHLASGVAVIAAACGARSSLLDGERPRFRNTNSQFVAGQYVVAFV